ncbi:MAG: hypothetical protein MRZ79_25895 [Bacteroidia bacterium]|nr:hypothetical protein [Bacteroidia bacterium]
MELLSKNTLKLFLVAFFAGSMLVSCDDANIGNLLGSTEVGAEEVADAVEDAAARGSADSSGRHRDGCFDLVYPVTLSFPDGTSSVADSAEELYDLIQDWKINNGDSAGRPSLVFPLDVVLSDGTTETVDDEDEFKEILADCGYGKGKRGKRGGKKHKRASACYEILFPVSVSFPNNTTAVADSAGELKQLIRDWKANDSTNLGRPSLVFPFDVTILADGSTITVTSETTLDSIRNECFQGGRGTRCGNDSTGVSP